MSWRNGKTTKQRGYDGRWRKAREHYLSHHPLCVYCQREGRITPATVVDHIIPHKGDARLFWDKTNWQSLCKHCHDSIKQREENSKIGCNEKGFPLDPNHHWYGGG
ncbi:HNH endonuclease [Suttonella ornithocola]|uniref:Putative HNH nuclease YajD n=1 Tax=Suttonella ornithocola TaxID=279832 RepID=A0A380MSG2_9GAMM|nr:HNH endonuclease signature motif containing protein [Suttonella ornithocola]SUO95242.1 HNH endonuclease [Suttonella ornithocola]